MGVVNFFGRSVAHQFEGIITTLTVGAGYACTVFGMFVRS
jgi:hypothetical protein